VSAGHTPEAVLLDRDGTINAKAPEGEYITRPAQLELLPGAGEAIRLLNDALVPVVVVTNQRGIALHQMSERDLAEVHARLAELLAREGATLQGILHCPHDKGVCACRKPGTLLLERARTQLGLATLRNTMMIGDSLSDIEAGLAVGAATVLLTEGDDAPPTVATARSLLQAVREYSIGSAAE
jgi:D-glycero-D-manno-heptose 1,7-bisphosphate phosphatase